MTIARAQLIPFCLPLDHPVRTAHGEVAKRDGMLLCFENESGVRGWGEASPFPGFGGEDFATARLFLGEWLPLIVSKGEVALTEMRASAQTAPVAYSGIENALLDLEARERRTPLANLIGVANGVEPLHEVPVNALIMGEAGSDVRERARVACAQGFTTFKLKVGGRALEEDLERVAALRRAVGDEASIRLDANQAWPRAQAARAVASFEPFAIEYLEEPIEGSDPETLAWLRDHSPIPIAVDESLVDGPSCEAILEAGAADVFILKPSLLGGAANAVEVARKIRAAGGRVVVTSLLDSAVAVSAGLHVAGLLGGEGELPACGLGTGQLFACDFALLGPPRAGRLTLPEGAGIGFEPDLEVVARTAVGEAREWRR